MTNNQLLALEILGYLPKGHISCIENAGVRQRVGIIYAGKRAIASVPASLNGGKLPQPTNRK